MKPSTSNLQPATYEDRSALADAEAMQARLVEDSQKFALFKTEITGVEKHFVQAANLGREIGISFQGYYLPPKRELAEGWFNKNYGKALGLSFDQFNWFIAMARKLPDKCKSMADAMPASQLALFAGDLIALPERTAPQTSHETTPYTYFFNSLRGLQSDLEKRLEDARDARGQWLWDEQTRSTIKEEIERTEKFLGAAKERLG